VTSATSTQTDPHDVFMAAYLAGSPAPLPAVRSGAKLRVPNDALALGGLVLTPAGPLRGWLTIEAGRITRISSRKPTGVRVLVTDGVILPGLVDLHGHPEFNVFAAWEPPRTFVNRYSWRASDAYGALIREPQNKLLTSLPAGTELRYAEIRALVSGTTAIQGASGRTGGAGESLVRNVDGTIFGEHHARTLIDLPADLTSRGGETLTSILDGIQAGDVDAFYVHLAEGQRSNQRSIDEFDRLVAMHALTPATVMIHGSALTRAQLGDAADAGAKLVWSPQSNLRLYGETTRASDAIDVGLPMGLGADWLPSGSTSLLAELKVARRELANQGRPIKAADLVRMVTSGAAQIAGLGDKLGSLEIDRPADVLVLDRCDPDPYESVCSSNPSDVELVFIGGDLAYGRADWVRELAPGATAEQLEPVLAWGRPMLLDTSFQGQPDADGAPRLAQLRAALTSTYPPVGPIWA